MKEIENNSVNDFLNRQGEFAPISYKKLETIESTVTLSLEDNRSYDFSERTEMQAPKTNLQTSAVCPSVDVNISNKVKEILEESKIGSFNSYFQSLQQWLGHVVSIENSMFTARLIDQANPGTYEIGEFEIRDIPEGDLDLFKIGAAFYWSLGYYYNGSNKTKESSIRFQRLNDWTEDEYDAAIDRADELYQFFTK